MCISTKTTFDPRRVINETSKRSFFIGKSPATEFGGPFG